MARTKLGMIAASAAAAAAVNPEPSSLPPVSKKRKRGFRLTMPKKKRRVFEGFDAFEDHIGQVGQELVGPQEGIHSLAWAQAIVPQGSLLSLPIEVRNKIYGYVFGDNANHSIKPKKAKKKFRNVAEPGNNLTTTYTTLSQVSRQFYVDITGSGLLYTLANFHFISPYTMHNYLSVINPYHHLNFRTITFRVRITSTTSTIPTRALVTLASLPCLQHLTIEFDVDKYLCTLESSRNVKRRMYRVKDKVLARLQDAKWAVLGGKLRSFGVEMVVSPKVVDRRFHTYHDREDARVTELEGRIRGVVLRK